MKSGVELTSKFDFLAEIDYGKELKFSLKQRNVNCNLQQSWKQRANGFDEIKLS